MKWIDRSLDSVRVSRRLAPYLREHRGALVLACMLSLGTAMLELLRPWPIQWIFDGALVPVAGRAVERSPTFYVWTGVGALLCVTLVRALLEYFATLRIAQTGHAVTRTLRLALFRHMTELSPLFHARHKAGDLLMRLMGDVPMVQTMLVDSAVMMLTRVMLAAGTLAVMFYVDSLLAWIVVGMIPVLLLCVRLLARTVTVAVRKQRRKEGALADFLQEAIGGTTVLQALGGSGHWVRRFARSNRRSARSGLKAARAGARLGASVEGLLACSLAGTLAVGALRVLDGHLTPGELLVFLSYVRGIAKPVRSASKHATKIAKGTACGERLLTVLDESRAMRASAGERLAPREPRRLAFEGVSFGYGPDEEALRGVDLALDPGQLVALVGDSGAGKSTLVALAVRLFDPTRGRVTLDGEPLASYDLDSLREAVAVSLQTTVLFGDTIRENLALVRPDAQDAELEEALKAAGALDFVEALPGGMDAELGAAGSSLSGGQRRRLCLARTFLRRAPILIVDEPFTGLDPRAAAHVLEALRARARAGLVLVITHDVERLPDFDRVVYLERGEVVADGVHAELARSSERYAAACRLYSDEELSV